MPWRISSVGGYCEVMANLRSLVPVALLAAAVLVVAGCSPAPAGSVSTSLPSSSALLKTSSPVVQTPAPLGAAQSVTFEGGDSVGVTVYGVRAVVPVEGAPSFLGRGVSNTALDVRVCPGLTTTVQGMDRWSLVDASDGRYAAVTGMNTPKPEYPFFPVTVAGGECVRGWVMFETKDGTPVVAARYALPDGTVLRWTL